MDDLVYVWAWYGVHCNREELSSYLMRLPNDYEVMTEVEFFEQYPEGKL